MSQFGPEQDAKSLTNARAAQQAAERGCEVVVSDDYTLQLDIDNDKDYAFFFEQFERLTKYVAIVNPHPDDLEFEPNPWIEWRSRSGNRHITIKLKNPMNVVERIMLQACLGSDRVREILSYARSLNGEPHPVLLFKPLPKQLAVKEPKQLTAGDDDLLGWLV